MVKIKTAYFKLVICFEATGLLKCSLHSLFMPSVLMLIITFLAFPVIMLSQATINIAREENRQKGEASKNLIDEDYQKHAMARNGNPVHGRKLFAGKRALCTQCHSTDGSSLLAGPDLAAAGNKFTRSDLILSVLKPSLNLSLIHI